MVDFSFTQPDAAPPATPAYNFTMPASDGELAPLGNVKETPVFTTINAFVDNSANASQANTLNRLADNTTDPVAAAGYRQQATDLLNQAGAVLFTLDANVNEVIEYESDVTQYPVEDGSPVSDNISIKSQALSIDGVITNMAMTKGNANNVGRSKLQLAKSVLEGIYLARQVVTITSGLSVYPSMAIKNIRIGRSSGKGELTVAMRLLQIRKVVLKTTAANFASGKTAGKAGATKAKVTNQDDTPDPTKQAKGTTILGALSAKLFN